MKKEAVKKINLNSFIVVATFFSLWLAVFFEKGVEDFLAYFIILTIGILHGANDIKLLQKADKNVSAKKNFIKTLFYYSLFIGCGALLFFFLPILALLLFVMFSGFHFGEQHWMSKIKKSSHLNSVTFFSYGLLILFLIFSAHGKEVSLIIEEICRVYLPVRFYDYGALILGLSTCFFCTWAYIKRTLFFKVLKQLFFILVFFIVFNTASLLWAFAIYFVLWHSLPSMVDQIHYLYGDTKTKSIRKYIWSSFPYWSISVFGIALIVFFFKDNMKAILALFFSFLAAITFPHVFVINKLNRESNFLD